MSRYQQEIEAVERWDAMIKRSFRFTETTDPRQNRRMIHITIQAAKAVRHAPMFDLMVERGVTKKLRSLQRRTSKKHRLELMAFRRRVALEQFLEAKSQHTFPLREA